MMYARTTTFLAQPQSIDAGIEHVRDTVMPALERLDGYTGLSLLVDRSTGRCIATSAWETEEAMRTSTESIRPVRDRAAEIFGATPDVEHWEIAVLHRDHQSGDGAGVRATWVKVDSNHIDEALDVYKTSVLPALEELEGFCSASLLIDRASGRAVSSASYDSVGAMERNRDKLDRLRSSGTQEAGAEVLDDCSFELAIAHLRVPEMV
jgi:heme-degrading monooxygenase HmoA